MAVLSGNSIVQRLSWKFILYQASQPPRSYPDPSRRHVSRYLTAERLVLEAIGKKCRLCEISSLQVSFQPMYDALERDVESYGETRSRGRRLLFSTALERHIDGVSAAESLAWWFVWVFTHSAGSWGRIGGIEYFEQWLGDEALDLIDSVVRIDVHAWSEYDQKACMDELEVATRSREAMMNLFLFSPDDDDDDDADDEVNEH